jgi:hypothetical protein
MPATLSFNTFDAQRDKMGPEKNILLFSAYVTDSLPLADKFAHTYTYKVVQEKWNRGTRE